uniref:Uncharacterized protein n=1 Tax=Arundo donax TaxID=35708 RepID=A0A0A9BST9_ARUDO
MPIKYREIYDLGYLKKEKKILNYIIYITQLCGQQPTELYS